MTLHRSLAGIFASALLATASQGALAQSQPLSAPEAAPLPAPVPDAQDVPYPGTMRVDIDASDTTRALYRVTQTIPVARGTSELILQLPAWLPGNHAPRGPLNLIADVRFEVNGRPVAWTRDPVEVFAYRVHLPEGAREVTARFVHTSPLQSNEGRITMTQEMLNLQWEKMTLYPAGHYVRQIKVTPTVTFPEGWTVFTALDGQRDAGGNGNRVTWDTTSYEVLVDSPVFAGEHARSWEIGEAVEMNVVSDEASQLEIKPENMETYRRLIAETVALFGSRPFDHYEFLLGLTDKLGGIGLEHHRSSENTYEPNSFVDWDTMAHDRNVISHELVHSWNGKYRRPEGIWTPDYREPMRDNLLWMYEGQTQFWGNVLAVRSGMQPKEFVLGAMATAAGYYATQPGRAWRSVEDTTHDPIINSRAPRPYTSIHRDEDYYNEGALVWLEADQIIREGTGGAKGLDDFAAIFFAARDGDYGQVTYTFEDIVSTLNQVHAYNWASFLTERLRTPGQPAPLGGVEKAGYRLVWKEEPNPNRAGQMKTGEFLDLLYSLGVNLDSKGEVTQTVWDSPAFKAGLVDGAQIVAVAGEAYSADEIKQAITAAKTSGEPITLTVKRGDRFLNMSIEYDGGLRYPWLEPAAEGEQGFDRLLAPKVTPAG
jgi:predicted metalloprotease with PDZ domain